MRSEFRITASMTALMAAAAICVTGAAVGETLAGSSAPVAETNTENGVHAVPSGHVDVTTLAKPGAKRAAKPAVSAMPERLTVQLADPAPEPIASPPPGQIAVAEPAEGPEEDAVYRRAVAPATPPPAVAAAAAAAKVTPASLETRDAPAAPASMNQHVAFPRRSAEAASAFDSYMHAVAAIDAGFKSGESVAAALKRASAYDPRQLEEGMIAYGAMAAMQSPRFVYGVMDMAADAQSRRSLIETLVADPGAAARLPGATEASELASSAILREAKPVLENGRALKQASYDVQHQDWSIAKATNQTARLAQAKAASQAHIAPRQGDVARLLNQVTTVTVETGRLASAPSPLIAHSLALAALAILDGAQGGDDGRLEAVVSERDTAECLKMAKLNLFQCLSVAGPEYEDVYCLSQHAVLDTGQCVAKAASPSSTALLSEAPRLSRRPE